MTNQQLDEERIFSVARKISDVEARSEYLDQVCAGDQALRERVESLLAVHEKEQDFLRSADKAVVSTVDQGAAIEKLGISIGRYKLMEQIGEGGMGTVFVAQQERPIRRKVALKVIKPGMDSKSVVARFEAERQALAMMDHPNIAKVLDAGTTQSGRPYFAMELVKGVPITGYCDRNRLTIPERLELFIQVCQAIQHAHQKGIVHRDIKPSNVLITLHDSKPVPKVIDFGVAKAINARLTDKTIYTEHLQVVGTLLYMSPEQAELSGLDVDTRSDIYSLGVLLYELLTGTTPFQKDELNKAGFDEQRRIIRDKEPPRASVRISSLGETATIVAEHRKTDAKKLRDTIRGELDWVILKSMEKDRTRRYETADALGKDAKRYLTGDPVEAHPPSISYRLTKHVARNRVLIAVASLIFAILSISLVVTATQAKNNRRLREIAEQNEGKALSALGKLRDALGRANAAEIKATAAFNAERDIRIRSQQQAYQYGLNLAYEAWNQGDRGQFEQLVMDLVPAPSQEDFRGIEWRHLFERYRELQRAPVAEIGQPARSIAYSPDGNYMAIACGRLLLRDVLSGNDEELHADDNLAKVSFSRSGKLLVCSRADKFASTVALWRMPERRPIESDWLKDLELASVSISPDDSMLAGVLLDGRVRVHQFPEGEVLWTSDVVHAGGGDDNEFRLAFSPDGTMLATGSRDKKLFLWDLKTGDRLDAHATSTWVTSLVFSNTGAKLATTGSAGFTVWDVLQRKLAVPEFKEKQIGESRCLAFSPDDSMLAVGSVDRSVHLYNSATLSRIARLLHTSYPNSVAFSPNGEQLTAGLRQGVCKWDKASWVDNDTRPCSMHWHLNVAVSPSGFIARPVDTDGGYAINVWDPSTDNESTITKVLPKDSLPHPPAVAFSPDGSILAIGGDDGVLRLHDLHTGKNSEHQLHNRRIYSIAFSPDGTLVASGGRGPALGVLELESGKSLDMPETFQSQEDAVWVRFSKDGRLAAGGGDWGKYGELRIWEFVSGQPNLILKTHHPEIVRCLDFSPDGDRIVVTDDFGSARFHVYELSTREKVLEFGGPAKTMSVVFSSDGQRLITGSDDESIRFWDASNGERLGKLQTKGRVRALAVFPDGSAFVSASRDGFVRIWRAAPLQ